MISYLSLHPYLLGRLLGLLTILCMAGSFFVRSRSSFFALQVAGNLCNVFTLLLSALYASAIGCAIATLRMAIYYGYGKKKKAVPPLVTALLLGATVVGFVVLYRQPLDLLFLTGLIGFTLICQIPDDRVMKLWLTCPFVLYTVYGFFTGTFGLAVSSCIEAVASVLSFAFAYVKRKKESRASVRLQPIKTV